VTRRLRGDFIEIYKILQRKEDIDHRQFFEIESSGHELRGHGLKLYEQYNRLNIMKHLFSQRVLIALNALPSSVVDATSVNSLKRNLDEFWKDMGIKSPSSFKIQARFKQDYTRRKASLNSSIDDAEKK